MNAFRSIPETFESHLFVTTLTTYVARKNPQDDPSIAAFCQLNMRSVKDNIFDTLFDDAKNFIIDAGSLEGKEPIPESDREEYAIWILFVEQVLQVVFTEEFVENNLSKVKNAMGTKESLLLMQSHKEEIRDAHLQFTTQWSRVRELIEGFSLAAAPKKKRRIK
jgi:hypothetical protein